MRAARVAEKGGTLPRPRAAWICGTALLVLALVAPRAARAEGDDPEEKPSAAPQAPTATAAVQATSPEPRDGWTFFTTGRVSTFFSWARGDGMPQATTYDLTTDMPLHAVLTNTGGTGAGDQSSVPATKSDGTPSTVALVNSI